jgi:hypothetical protein
MGQEVVRLQLIAFFCLAAWSLASMAANVSSVSKADRGRLFEEVKQNGARRTVLRLQANPREWKQVMDNIAAAQREWIDLAMSLKAGSDAAAGTELRDAMFRALKRNPSYVLEHAQVGGFPLAVLCLGRAAPLPTYQQAIAEVEAVKKALIKVQAEALHAKKDLCLAQLREGRGILRRHFGLDGG